MTLATHNACNQVLAFPCNQFGAQEPGTDADIQQFAREQYSATFPIFGKIDVNGANAAPIFSMLKVRCHARLHATNSYSTRLCVGADGIPRAGCCCRRHPVEFCGTLWSRVLRMHLTHDNTEIPSQSRR